MFIKHLSQKGEKLFAPYIKIMSHTRAEFKYVCSKHIGELENLPDSDPEENPSDPLFNKRLPHKAHQSFSFPSQPRLRPIKYPESEISFLELPPLLCQFTESKKYSEIEFETSPSPVEWNSDYKTKKEFHQLREFEEKFLDVSEELLLVNQDRGLSELDLDSFSSSNTSPSSSICNTPNFTLGKSLFDYIDQEVHQYQISTFASSANTIYNPIVAIYHHYCLELPTIFLFLKRQKRAKVCFLLSLLFPFKKQLFFGVNQRTTN
eukprot:TRINITY_DN2003_c0_g1_i2.p1 TRINITY_DN2003_c0_g1~~TRINITY_DN2003_c0_g1_i2.p1  ORF type:complete len:263 (+),score=12.64 TRINITY_DN2003_c0_g1_i2:145-933(+)